MTTEITLGSRRVLLDKEDFDRRTRYGRIGEMNWNYNEQKKCVWCRIPASKSGKTNDAGEPVSVTIYLHRLIAKTKKGYVTRFENGDGLDCRRKNLVTMSVAKFRQMRPDRRKSENRRGKNLSKYRGVRWHDARQKWVVRIHFEGKSLYLGVFDKESLAGRAYDLAALALFPAGAPLNFKADDYSEKQVQTMREYIKGKAQKYKHSKSILQILQETS